MTGAAGVGSTPTGSSNAGRAPVIGITTDLFMRDRLERSTVARAYGRAVRRAGGLPVLLSPDAAGVDGAAGGPVDESALRQMLSMLDGLVLTGGDNPRTEPFGRPTHPVAAEHAVFEDRQTFEARLLACVLHPEGAEQPLAVLGVCLGMQMMSLVAEGTLHQHLPERFAGESDPDRHWDRDHGVRAERALELGGGLRLEGTCHSRHRQAVDDPGAMRIAAWSPDGVIEAIVFDDLPFCLGVQWHPERTDDAALGQALFDGLVRASAARRLTR